MRWLADKTTLAVGILVACGAAVTPSRVGAQEARARGARAIAVDTVVGVQDFSAGNRQSPAQVFMDLAGTVEVAPRVHATMRPKLWREGGQWRPLLDQASVRYDFEKGSQWRLEAGRFASPIGLGMTENRPNLNAGVMWCHRPYYMSLPSLGPGAPTTSLVSAVYPTGGQLSTSTDRWDARVAVLDRAPIEFWLQEPGTTRRANLIVGGGITPRQGVRIGAAAAGGRLPATSARPNRGWSYRLFNVEGEAAIAHTKVSAEWTRHSVDIPPSDEAPVAQGWTIQVRQTLTPRLFAHSRASSMQAPEWQSAGFVRRHHHAIDSSVGYLVNEELTVRLGHSVVRAFSGGRIDHQVGVSVMWTRRWW